jgi:hypothetical protein
MTNVRLDCGGSIAAVTRLDYRENWREIQNVSPLALIMVNATFLLTTCNFKGSLEVFCHKRH